MPAPNGTGEWELFDLKQDPGELNDLGKKHPQKLKELVARWEQYKKDNGVLDLSSGGQVVEARSCDHGMRAGSQARCIAAID